VSRSRLYPDQAGNKTHPGAEGDDHFRIVSKMGRYLFDRQQGVALVIVLWVIALLGVIAASYALSTRIETALTRNWLESNQARALAKAGVQIAILELLRPATTDAEAENKWRADGTVYETSFAGAGLRIAIADETGKIDLNGAPAGLIDGLLQTTNIEENERLKLLDAILDWRDDDELERLNGAEDDEYRAAGLQYRPKNGPFDNVEELSLVLGMSAGLYHELEGALTVYTGAKGINPDVASAQVLLAIPGIDPAQVDVYSAQKAQNVIDGLPPPPSPIIDREYQTGGVGRDTYSVHVEVNMPSGAVERIAAVVRLTRYGGPFELISWQEAADLMFE
jgi:general secretion pathway protein K